MARPLRIELPDGVYHVTSRGLERRAIVVDDRDREKWLDLLARVASQRQWRVFAWVLMNNHYHLYLQTPHADLSRGMHDLNSGYVSAFNRRHGRCGPLFQGRFKAILVEREGHDWELSRYIHLNPVRAGLVEHPRDYRWSSCRFYLGDGMPPEWLACEDLLSQHGGTLREARKAYSEYLLKEVSAQESPLRRVVASSILGSRSFVERIKNWLEERLPDRELPATRVLRRRPSVEEVEATVCKEFGVELEQLHKRGFHSKGARAVAIYLSRQKTGESVSALGERFGGVSVSAVSKVCSRLAARLARDRQLARRVSACEAELDSLSNVKT